MGTCQWHPGVDASARCSRCLRAVCDDCRRPSQHDPDPLCPLCAAPTPAPTRPHTGRPAAGSSSAATPIPGTAATHADVDWSTPVISQARRAAAPPPRLPLPRLTTGILVGLNVLVWIAVMATGGRASLLVDELGLARRGKCQPPGDPAHWFPAVTRADCATFGQQWVPGFTDGAWWQPLTSAFLHCDPLHLAFNVLALWLLGPSLELAIGRARYLLVYLGSAVSGSALVLALAPAQATTLGASGALMGLLGGLLLAGWWAAVDIRPLLMWVVANVAVTVAGIGSISWQGHLGGFVGGLLTTLAVLLVARVPRRKPTSRGRRVG